MTESGTFVTVRGNIEYSRLLTPIAGEELERDKARRRQAGSQPIEQPYTTVQIGNARVLPRDPSGMMTLEEAYVAKCMFQRIGDGPNGDWHFVCANRDTSQPNQFFLSHPSNPTEYDTIIPEHELGKGLDVILILRVSEMPPSREKDIRLHSVVLQEPIRYSRQEG